MEHGVNKAGFVHKIFSQVADHYDLMNDLMSFGIHRIWKRRMINALPSANGRMLDVAGGTADIAIRSALRCNAEITVCDINYVMLAHGRDNAIDANLTKFKWLCANAEQLPLPDNYFDCYTIAFGIRNVSNRIKALSEAYRVLKPGGKFLCLEFSPPGRKDIINKIYDIYSLKVIPKIGRFVANNEEAYQYLVESIRMFPNVVDFSKEINSIGFQNVTFEQMTHGTVSLHSAWKIPCVDNF